MNFDIPIYNDIMYLLEEIGQNCKVNNVPAKAIVNNVNNEYDDKRIITNEELQRGYYIEYNNLFFLVIDDTLDQRYKTYYKSKMRKCNYDIKFIINNNLYQFPAIVEGERFYINQDKVLDMAADIISVTLPYTDVTKLIEKLQCFIKFNQKWEIQGIDYSKDGLIILNCKMKTYGSSDDMENEIADRYDDLENDVLNGNITPILPFNEETIPDEPEEPEEPDEPEEPEEPEEDNFTYVIDGADEIMWNQTKTYTVHKYNNGVEVDGVFTFELIGDYADIVDTTDNTVDIKARNSVLGFVTLKATDVDNGEIVEKKILNKGLI